jgi:hypothetical protein
MITEAVGAVTPVSQVPVVVGTPTPVIQVALAVGGPTPVRKDAVPLGAGTPVKNEAVDEGTEGSEGATTASRRTPSQFLIGRGEEPVSKVLV